MGDKHIPAARIRKVWMNRRLTTTQAAQRVGLSRSNLWRRAVALGLPPRPRGRRPVVSDATLFAVLWDAGVLAREIARVFDCHVLTVSETAGTLGLARRRQGGGQKCLTLAAFVEGMASEALACRLRAQAQVEMQALAACEMVDAVRRGGMRRAA